MIKRIPGNEKEQAGEVGKMIVDAIANGEYALIEKTADSMGEAGWTAGEIKEYIETFIEDNGLSAFDPYDTPCKFNPVYKDGSKYEQEKFYFFNDGSGFRYEYDFTIDGDLNDLTLMLSFNYRGDTIEVVFDDMHVL